MTYIKKFLPVKSNMEQDTYLYKRTFPIPHAGMAALSDLRLPENAGSEETKIEMTGNWLIRWTATDSDLPFAFMRAYHRQLANYLPVLQPSNPQVVAISQLVQAPGYIFIAATLLEVCDALIHRNLRSVTTVSGLGTSLAKSRLSLNCFQMAPSNTGVNANESANMAAGQKPKALEVVSKRVVQTIFEVVGGPLQPGTASSSPQAFMSAALRQNFSASLSMWIKADKHVSGQAVARLTSRPSTPSSSFARCTKSSHSSRQSSYSRRPRIA